MKINRLIDKVGNLLSASRRRQQARRAKLKTLLKEMKRRRRALQEEIAASQDLMRRAELEQKLRILTEQRRKGVQLHRELLRAERGEVELPVDGTDV